MEQLVEVNDQMQKGYRYYRMVAAGTEFHPEFEPQLTPKEMLELGVFGGRYMTDCIEEFPASWYAKAKLSPNIKDILLNYFRVDASLPLSHWQSKGWIYHEDPRGWFQWYCRYFMGRRIETEDLHQIKRRKAIRRHKGAIVKNCEPYDFSCRKKQRQALLHWAYDSRQI